jgi:ketosteroid isomerase-like protein
MDITPTDTKSVVQNHLQAFVEQKGIDAILRDYDDKACFLGESRIYYGTREIRDFFEAFIASLPPNATNRFSLRTLRVEGEIAYITWSVGDQVPFGTDTFLVRDGKIVSQTFAMHPPAAA